MHQPEKNWQDLPLVLSPADVKRILTCGSNTVYTLFHSADFPAIKVGKSFKVSRDAFRAWLERQA